MKFLVILHIYYEYMWQELKSYLLNLEEGSYDLVVTLSKENEELKKEILLLNPNSKIILCENRGYDVWPFIKALKEVNLDNYKYLIKLHTKRDLPKDVNIIIADKYFFKGSRWRSLLLSFISSKENLDKCVKTLDENESVGMINSKMLLDKTKFKQRFRDPHLKYCINEAKRLLDSIDVDVKPASYVEYIGGTMFIARADIFKPLLKLGLKAEDFRTVERDNENELAHVIERVMGWLVTSNGYTFDDPYTTKEFLKSLRWESFVCRIQTIPIRHRLLNKTIRFLFRCDKVEDYREIRVFKIKLFKIKCKK